jgi:GTP cyclohydrolase IA
MHDLEKKAEEFLEAIGVNTKLPGTRDTPKRMVNAYKELFSGMTEEPPTLTTFPNENSSSDIVMSDCIPFNSYCEHHIMPFQGVCWILYIPNVDTIIGFSKFARIVKYFASRPQIQERLVSQIADFIEAVAKPRGVMVFSRAKHLCAMCRGAKSGPTNGLTTSTVRGIFSESPSLELKGLEMIKLSIGLERGL